jgi:hypothetical protein
MADMLDYLAWRGDIEFPQMPVNAVDALIFSTLSYIDFKDIVPDNPDQSISLQQAAEGLLSLAEPEKRTRVKKDLELLQAAAKSARFDNIKMTFYRSILIAEEDTQFAAVTIFLEDGSAYIAFRGTDSTLTGWKEDFNMSFQSSIPSQHLALEYVQEFAAAHPVPLWMGGHSKGGNLAVFAAAKCGELLQKRIVEVYNQDGPGFSEEMMQDAGYRNILPKLRSYVPQSSVIGMLLEHEEPYTIIKSNQVGIMQHDPYSWQVLGPDFLRVEELTADSRFLDRTFKHWLSQMSNEERGAFFDTVFELLESTGAEHTGEIIRPQNVRAYLKTLKSNEYMRTVLASELVRLVASARQAQSGIAEQIEE